MNKLIEKYQAGELSSNELEELKTLLRDEAAGNEFARRVVENHSMIKVSREILAEAQMDIRTISSTRKPRLLTVRNLMMTAACLAVASLVFWHSFSGEVATLKVEAGSSLQVHREVRLREFNSVRRLFVGDRLSLSEGSATLRYEDGTQVNLLAPVNLQLLTTDQGAQLRLIQGEIQADVAKQEAGESLLIHTSSGTVRVIGTQFGLGVDGQSTWLEVTEGRVELKTESETVEVGAGEIARANGAGEIFCSTAAQKKERHSKVKKSPSIGSLVSVEHAIKDLINTFGARYPKGASYLKRLEQLKGKKGAQVEADLKLLKAEALLGNPLLDFDQILCVRRNYGAKARKMVDTTTGNYNAYAINRIRPSGHPSELVTLKNLRSQVQLASLFKFPYATAIAEVDLDADAGKVLFSAGTEKKDGDQWQLWQVNTDGSNLKRMSPADEYESFDGMYLPDGDVIFNSTAAQQGLPCEAGRILNSNLFKLSPQTNKIERLTFDQDSNWCPTMMANGRVMYLRWEYSDLAHMFSRILMTMNPDGTNQTAHYGTNSYWPNGMFDAKPIPGQPSRFVSVISGHHTSRPGTLALFDVAKGRKANKGLIAEIPDGGVKQTEIITDRLYGGRWPKCLNPYPLGTTSADGAGRYFLVSAKLTKTSLWGIYIVDIFGNFTLIREEEGFALNEPIPLRKNKRSPVIPSRLNPESKDGLVYIQDIYAGPGLKNVRRGDVKNLRLFTYHFAYGKSGSHDAIGVESSWDVKRVLGTVPVEKDGSAMFTVPANTPIALQPMDKNGASLQLMRSWFVARPGEKVSCIGCHEDQNMAPLARPSLAAKKAPESIKPWHGKVRGFSFLREIQPVLDRKCIGCHDGKPRKDGKTIPNYDDITEIPVAYQKDSKGKKIVQGGPFPKSYLELSKYVRRPGPESDIELLEPMEYHASTSILIQLLRKGHQNVKLADDEWERLHAWIDLNAPCYGTYTEAQRRWLNPDYRWAGAGKNPGELIKKLEQGRALRNRLMKEYAGYIDDPESEALTVAETLAARKGRKPVMPPKKRTVKKPANPKGWPFTAAQATKLQGNGSRTEQVVKIGDKQLTFRRIPAGSFVMGNLKGYEDEMPHRATVTKPFWMATTEVTNGLFKEFKKEHRNGWIDILGKDHQNGGINIEDPYYPVVRVSWDEAQAFCQWMSKKMASAGSALAGKLVRLPTEAEWEWAARAGTATDTYYGNCDVDFSKHANLADSEIEKFNFRRTHNYMLRVDTAADGLWTMGRYADSGIEQISDKKPNAFGLRNMIGNVAEWTASDYRAYPFKHSAKPGYRKVARGGSWRDLPRWATSSYRAAYRPHQKVYNVGIRLVIE
ncbi:hypothetical protein BVY04_03375 [bacterium M21]|nr:hypothetical protein BVY04_03375 [bacterium M21]